MRRRAACSQTDAMGTGRSDPNVQIHIGFVKCRLLGTSGASAYTPQTRPKSAQLQLKGIGVPATPPTFSGLLTLSTSPLAAV